MPIRKRVAGVQTDIRIGYANANLARMEEWLKRPELQNIDLVVFPECMLSGYCYDSLDEAWPHAQTIPGPATNRMIEACQRHQLHIAFGMLERGDTEHGERQLHNSCVLVGPQGLIGKYRKTHLPYLGIDRFVTAGSEPYRVFEVGGMRVGMHICYDASFPETCRLLSLAGADLLILPTNWPPGATNFAKYLPNARALENNVYFLAVNRVGTEGRFRFIGQSRLCETNGDSLVEALHEQEAILVGEIELERARTKRLVHVPNQHIIDRFADRRPDLYQPLAQDDPEPSSEVS
jgi:5-aminopentanamidase